MNYVPVSEVYNTHSYQYTTNFYRPWRVHTETYTVLKAMVYGQDLKNDVLAGINVLDLACGGGHYAREYLKLGAQRVVGVDISSHQTDNANFFTRSQGFAESRFGFYCADCGSLEQVKRALEGETVDKFDIVTAIWLLGNAPNRSVHRKMMAVASYYLKPGGKFIAITSNPVSFYNDDEIFQKLVPHGLLYERTEPENGILKRRVSFRNIEGSLMFAVYNYVFSQKEIETDLKTTGFNEIRQSAFDVDPENSKHVDPTLENFLKSIQECHALLVVAKKDSAEPNITIL
jgi:SAM-dependent methyltransferase